jgi:hypothetical protein
MTIASTVPRIRYRAGPPLFIVATTTATARAPTMKVFSEILLILRFADIALTASAGHHIYTHILMFKHFSQLITE